ncbi:putative CRISPR-associated protein [Gloeobacter kilaueensis]|uniref:CRISPR-associated protein, APE2256 family n=1 Tax=Gloeobacter kilaueensis (strain ATCC BAA-2537 / CCAP 1431/1 / ULC 316 / JS1) TaxID=1183438 RepID=U5QI44_GLOK1|nr:putative CRISPR-associated protein [Gloeobacter kilaueensis]AGY58606.1 CRISPR-associated protein, APE2256 family [Gloeobacter kilaueensis JS1]
MKDTLICTVGTSLLGNLKRAADQKLQNAYTSENWPEVLSLLKKLSVDAKICGAEINSTAAIVSRNYLDHCQRLILLYSDTPDGENVGKLLQSYFDSSKELAFKEVSARPLKGLTDRDVRSFQNKGLLSLVQEISELVRKYGLESVLINATGGYKAQISFAGMIGQAFDIPVFYLFENFSEIIELPPQPIALDLSLWLENYAAFEQIEEAEGELTFLEDLPLDIQQQVPALMFNLTPEGGKHFIELTAMGYLFHERCRLQFQRQETTLLNRIPQTDLLPERKRIDLRDDHGNDLLMKISKKLCQSPYVIEVVNSLPWNPKATKPIRRTTHNGLIDFVMVHTDRGLGVCLRTTGRTRVETNTIAAHLADRYG